MSRVLAFGPAARRAVHAAATLALLAGGGGLGATARAEPAGSPAARTEAPAAEAMIPALAQRQDALEAQGFMVRGQATFVLQGHPAFRSPYQGAGSLTPAAQARNTLSADLVLGVRPWRGAELILDTQVSRGFGLSGTTGVASFPNGEAFRLGTENLVGYVPRAFLRQTIALSATTVPGDDEDPLRFRGPLPAERITVTAGKVSVFDIFDDNRYAHDPRTQFLSWGLVSAGAFDFAADARGYTNGVAVEYDAPWGGFRAGAFQVARYINSLSLDPQPFNGYQLLLQADRFYQAGGRPGAIRLLYGFSRTRSQNWNELLDGDLADTSQNPAGYRTKNMLALNWEQEVADDLGVFARLSWNDGRGQNWMFTEQDRAVSLGVQMSGARWDRPRDTVGLGTNLGFISGGRQDFLARGGIGFITGDGRLAYAPEWASELYYDARVAPGLNVMLGGTLVANPAYNADRGPVGILSARLRIAF